MSKLSHFRCWTQSMFDFTVVASSFSNRYILWFKCSIFTFKSVTLHLTLIYPYPPFPILNWSDLLNWSNPSHLLCWSCTVNSLASFTVIRLPSPLLCPRESIEENLREGKAFSPQGTIWTVLGGKTGEFCRGRSIRLADKGWATGLFGRLLGTIHLGATAEQFHWDLKKILGGQSFFEFTSPAKKGGLLEWLRRR